MKPQRKEAGGRKSEQYPNHPHPKPSSVQSAVGSTHREWDSTATNERARTDHGHSRKTSSARNQPSYPSHNPATTARLCSIYDFIYVFIYLFPHFCGITNVLLHDPSRAGSEWRATRNMITFPQHLHSV